MSDNNLELTRRRALAGLLVVGGASAGLGAGTSAYLSDSVESQNNTIESGDIDLTTNGNDNPTTTINIDNAAPGQSGSKSINLNNKGSIGGHLSLEFGTPADRNDLTELLEITVKVGGNLVRKGTFDTVFDGEGEWSNADIPLGATNTKGLTIDWELPGGAGNDAADSEAKGDITINLNQQEEAFADVVVDPSGSATTIQEGVDAVPEDGVVLVRNGTYNEAVDIDTANVTLASKNDPSNPGRAKINTSASAQDNRAIEINGVSGVTIDGFEVTFNGDPSSNSEKYAIRARAVSDELTVRNCAIGGFSARDNSNNTGAVRTTGVTVDAIQGPGGSGTVTNPIIENNVFNNIKTAGGVDPGNSGNDSKAKGAALNGDVRNAAINNNDFTNIGQAGGSSETDANAEKVTDTDVGGTEKPRGITMVEDGNNEGPKRFTILDNLFQGIVGTFGQPAIFIGGSNSLGPDNEVYNNEFHHPVDNLSDGTLKLRDNTWVNDNAGLPQLKSPPGGTGDPEVDGGNLIDRAGGSEYDTTFTI